jgi:zinc transport system ATP-binding protein
MCEVQLEHINFAYNNVPALSDISVTFPAGNFSVIVGPNGAGKSTLLKIIAGLIVPDTGKLVVKGGSIAAARAAGIIGYVPQNYGKNSGDFPATVEEIVALGLVGGQRLTLHSRQAARHIVEHMMTMVGVTDLRHRRIGDLSGGQQQRVMVARALAGNPQLLLLDEPTSGIDCDASAKIYELLGQLNTNLGITVIMVSHDIDNATHRADKVACINRGLCFWGSAAEFHDTHAQARHLWYYTGQ